MFFVVGECTAELGTGAHNPEKRGGDFHTFDSFRFVLPAQRVAAVAIGAAIVSFVLYGKADEQRVRGIVTLAKAAKTEDPLIQVLLLAEVPDEWVNLIPLHVAAEGIRPVPLARFSHEREVLSAEWSPDGTRVLTTSEDKTARVEDEFLAERLRNMLLEPPDLLPTQFLGVDRG